MRAFIFERATHAAIVVVVVVTLVFTLFRLAPGDPFLANNERQATEEEHAAFRARWGYDKPIAVQYVRWVRNFAAGDFGWSHSVSRPVRDVLKSAMWNSTLLILPSLVLGWLAAVALGTWQAVRRRTAIARATDAAALTIVSVPDFMIALAALSIFAMRLHVAPTGGMIDVALHDSMSFAGRVADIAAHLGLPCATLALIVAVSVSRYHRVAVLGVLHEDFVRTARAKGLAERDVVLRHVVPNAIGPAIAIAGLLLPTLFAGAVFIEKIFGWPGVGSALVDAILGKDYELVQAIVVISTILVAAGAAAADVLAAMVNPRMRLAS